MAKKQSAKKVSVPKFDLTTTEGRMEARTWAREELDRVESDVFKSLDQRLRRIERHLGIHGDESADLH